MKLCLHMMFTFIPISIDDKNWNSSFLNTSILTKSIDYDTINYINTFIFLFIGA